MPRPLPPDVQDLPRLLELVSVVQDGEAVQTAACLLCPVTLDGTPAMLKATHEPEELRGLSALAHWDGRGAVRVLRRVGDVAVLERAGRPIRQIEPDDGQRTRMLCAAVARIHSLPAPADENFTPLRRHLRALFADTEPKFDKARDWARELLRDNDDEVPLHGDVHAENLLSSDRGPLLIDPKGVVGPRAFDYANIFTNWTLGEAAQHFDRRLDIVCAAADLDPGVMLQWIVVWSATSGIWHREDGNDVAAFFPHRIMDTALDRVGMRNL